MGAVDAVTAAPVQTAEVRRVEREGAWAFGSGGARRSNADVPGSNGGGWEEGSGLVEGTERDGDAGIACKLTSLVQPSRQPQESHSTRLSTSLKIAVRRSVTSIDARELCLRERLLICCCVLPIALHLRLGTLALTPQHFPSQNSVCRRAASLKTSQ